MALSNHFLDGLADADRRLLQPHLQKVSLRRDERVGEADEPVTTAYLPIDSILSVVQVMRDGRSIETRTIGREAGYGLLHAVGSRLAIERVIVQVPGEAYALPTQTLAAAAVQSPSLTKAIVSHGQATLAQTAQGIACNTLHAAEPRLCKWLLLTQDRLESDVLPLTQEHLSIMLGVQRTTVTALASDLQRRQAISYSRGRIRVLDRPALIACACECYEITERRTAELVEASERKTATNGVQPNAAGLP